MEIIFMNKITEEHKVKRLQAAAGDNSGEVDLIWQPVKLANSYIVQVSFGIKNEKNWKYADIVSRSKYTVTGLKSGRKYNFRIAAITTGGQQCWSEPVSQITE